MDDLIPPFCALSAQQIRRFKTWVTRIPRAEREAHRVSAAQRPPQNRGWLYDWWMHYETTGEYP